MVILYVSSDRPQAGKTALCVALANDLKQQGRSAVVFKPVAAAAEPDEDPDTAVYRDLLGQSEADWPYALTRNSLSAPLLRKIAGAAGELSDAYDVVLVEGSSRLAREDEIKIAEALDAMVLVVARYRPELEAAELAAVRSEVGKRLIGFVINGLTRYKGTDASTRLLPALESRGLVSLGVVPEDRTLLSVSVGQLVAQVEGRFIAGEEVANGLVTHVLVGGMGLDSGDLYFGLRQNKAVIVRGDRPDVQMAALASPPSCMVLTNGIEPIEYVLNEAELEGVPLIGVESDTIRTMDLLNGMVDGARFDHPTKLDRFSELLREHVDTDAIYRGLGLAS